MSTDSEPLISCFQLGFRTERGSIDPVSIQVHPHEWVEVTGTAGCGKTLFFQVLSLQVVLPNAKVVVQRRNIARTPSHEIAELRRSFGSCPQRPLYLENRTVCENLVLPMVARRRIDGALQHAEELLEEFGSAGLRDVPVGELSYQDRVVVAVMRACMGEPSIILIDSIFDTVSLDYQNTIFDALQRRHEKGVALVLFAVAPTAMNSSATLFELEAPDWGAFGR